ncbi:MAG: peptidylprolyl isomerase [Betaproteobacteria bacterium]|nr:peptidylprolyl isomerase [Betaproteobacteria bacterium]
MTHRSAAIVFALALAAAVPATAQLKDDKGAASNTAATVNGKAIPKARVDFILKQRAAQGNQPGQPQQAPFDSEQARKAIIDDQITSEVIVQEAERSGFTKRSETQMQLDLARQQVVIQTFLQNHFRNHPISEDAIKAEYAKVRAQRGDREFKARHILVDTETDAKDLVVKLKKGGKFEELAKVSKDASNKDRGGDLDWAPATNYVKPFADALAKLEKGKITDAPVQTQFGWHVIQLDDSRQVQFPAYEQVKPQIQNMMQQQEVQKLARELRAKAKIE